MLSCQRLLKSGRFRFRHAMQDYLRRCGSSLLEHERVPRADAVGILPGSNGRVRADQDPGRLRVGGSGVIEAGDRTRFSKSMWRVLSQRSYLVEIWIVLGSQQDDGLTPDWNPGRVCPVGFECFPGVRGVFPGVWPAWPPGGPNPDDIGNPWACAGAVLVFMRGS